MEKLGQWLYCGLVRDTYKTDIDGERLRTSEMINGAFATARSLPLYITKVFYTVVWPVESLNGVFALYYIYTYLCHSPIRVLAASGQYIGSLWSIL